MIVIRYNIFKIFHSFIDKLWKNFISENFIKLINNIYFGITDIIRAMSNKNTVAERKV